MPTTCRTASIAFAVLCLFSCTKELQQPQTMAPETALSKNKPVASTGLIAAVGDCDYNPTEASLLSGGWTLAFADEFSGGLEKWNIWNGGAYNYELQLYQAANLQTEGGLLSIIARREAAKGPTLPFDATPKDFAFTSGRIESKTSFSASPATPKVRMVARLKLPSGYGMWPAFWSYGDPWPTQGEIDIMEARGHEPFKFSTAYWYGRRAGVNQAANTEGYITTTSSLTDCWHVYELIWEKSTLSFYLDGKLIEVKSGGLIPNMYRKSQRVVLNLAVGGAFFGNPDPSQIVPGTLIADWVRVYTGK
ncbi:Glycosyl hydrolases family 16 [Cnuella takakiae]|uniref:Glycosyl hydrolases family 16 n=1 Tax=Cnuella takakiae TaxID=1302690 RepID=A0A1M4Y6X3_9BACT|nr:glycoside hydrolase family 16 protein [Cnuella takakiae]OLY93066.1 hypothetical protein BUE76_15055 [Cnuella takakiae]SHF01429.1 Glycosyl hydrolases family 16 [Cnuella takakiae]